MKMSTKILLKTAVIQTTGWIKILTQFAIAGLVNFLMIIGGVSIAGYDISAAPDNITIELNKQPEINIQTDISQE